MDKVDLFQIQNQDRAPIGVLNLVMRVSFQLHLSLQLETSGFLTLSASQTEFLLHKLLRLNKDTTRDKLSVNQASA